MPRKDIVLICPFRFATVENELFRGAYPTYLNFSFLRRLKLKSILSLIPSIPTEELQNFCKSENIDNIYIPVKKIKEEITISHSKVIEILELVLDYSKYPLYVHCSDGTKVTGLIMMCLRKVQLWTAQSSINEFSRFVVMKEESEFVDQLNEISLPAKLPPWLWRGNKIEYHPNLNLKYCTSDIDETKRLQRQTFKERMLRDDNVLFKDKSPTIKNVDDFNDDDDDDDFEPETQSQVVSALALEGFNAFPTSTKHNFRDIL